MAKILITGVGGFVGQHLAQESFKQGHEVHGISHSGELPNSLSGIVKDHNVCNLADYSAVKKLDLTSYSAIVNLAGLANVGESFKNPELYMKTNVSVLTNICKVALEQRSSCRIVGISTGAVYESAQTMPLREGSKTVLNGSPYAKSKLAMEDGALEFTEKGVDCVIARPFNHIGPGQQAGFLMFDLCRQLLESTTSESISVGTMSSKRDYTDVRDVARAYILLATTNKNDLSSNIYNICSGTARTGYSLLEELQKHIPGTEHIKIEVNPNLVRPNDPPVLVGSHDLITKDTHWQPSIAFEQTVEDIVQSVKKSN